MTSNLIYTMMYGSYEIRFSRFKWNRDWMESISGSVVTGECLHNLWHYFGNVLVF